MTEPTPSNNTILRINDHQTLALIRLYRAEECLWNTSHANYKVKVERTRAAHRIAARLNIPHFTPQHVLVKFKNLRNSYSQELKKIAQSALLGGDEYRPKVFWFSEMDAFIRPHLQPARAPPYDPLADASVGEHSGAEEEVRPRKRRRRGVQESEEHTASFGRYVAALVRALPPPRALALQAHIVQLLTEAVSEAWGEDAHPASPASPDTPDTRQHLIEGAFTLKQEEESE